MTLANHNLLSAKNWQLVKVAGSQAEAFLQGHLTNDIKRLDERPSSLAAACDAKGRMLASLYLFKLPDENGFCLFLPKEVWHNLAQFWQKYLVLYRQCAIEPMKGSCYIGNNAGGFSLAFNSIGWLRLSDEDLATTATWDTYLIDQAVPHVYTATIGQWIPQMLAYDRLGALSYDKGCYVGQEVIARVHYLGKPNRACQSVAFSMQQTPWINMPLYNTKHKPIGNLVNFYFLKGNSYRALAVLTTNLVDRQNVLVQDSELFKKVSLAPEATG